MQAVGRLGEEAFDAVAEGHAGTTVPADTPRLDSGQGVEERPESRLLQPRLNSRVEARVIEEEVVILLSLLQVRLVVQFSREVPQSRLNERFFQPLFVSVL